MEMTTSRDTSLTHPHVWVVIPAYNEGVSIQSVVKSVLKHVVHVVVVDDCSRDTTFKEAWEAGAHVLRHPINRGQGAALRTGMDYALLNDAEVIIHFDADGQHAADEIHSMIMPVVNGEVDVVLGSRFLGVATNLSFLRRIVLKGGVLFTSLVSGLRLTDTHNGFRVLSRNAAEKIRINQDGFSHASEILDEIALHKLSYKEMPVTITYTDYSIEKGQSSLNALKIAARIIWSKLH